MGLPWEERSFVVGHHYESHGSMVWSGGKIEVKRRGSEPMCVRRRQARSNTNQKRCNVVEAVTLWL